MGIWNCVKRLHSFYGEEARFHITSRKGEGTQVWIQIPCRSNVEEKDEGRKEKCDESVDSGR